MSLNENNLHSGYKISRQIYKISPKICFYLLNYILSFWFDPNVSDWYLHVINPLFWYTLHIHLKFNYQFNYESVSQESITFIYNGSNDFKPIFADFMKMGLS
jgi:hypothetical protein